MSIRQPWQHWISLGVITQGLIFGNIPVSLSQDFPYPPNSTFFTGQPPSFQGASAPYRGVYVPNVPYYFTVDLPTNSIESLGKIAIKPQVSPSTITFILSQTKAFFGTPDQRGEAIALQPTTQDPNTGDILIQFAQPVPPGNTVTVGIIAAQNPAIEGVYQFTVKAFPAGQEAITMTLGVGRIQIYGISRF